MRLVLPITSIALFAHCGPGEEDAAPREREPTWLDERAVSEEPPPLLSEIGLYDRDGSGGVHPDAVGYDPVWPLWSNGLTKTRHLVLPEGEEISVERPWSFPDGSLLFKTFEDDAGPVETRVMWNSPDEGWQWFVYVWAEGDAKRTDGRRSVDVDVEVGGERFTHNVPNEIDCKKCHEPDPNGVLGFESIQLGESLAGFEVFDERPIQEVVKHDDERTRDILGWMVGNCVGCHNGLVKHDQSSFDLSPENALENIVGVETASSASIDGVRVVPGNPQESVLYLAVSGESDDAELKLMPPVGVQRRDHEAIDRLRVWIEGLR